MTISGAVSDRIVGEVNIADYLLYQLNKQHQFQYVQVLGLKQPTDNINLLLTAIALKNNWLFKSTDLGTRRWKQMPDLDRSAVHFLKAFRAGNLGPFNFDYNLL